MAAAITDSIAADGQTVPSANLPMGNYRHTQVANAQARDDYAAAGQVQDGAFTTLANVAGSADAITATVGPPITSYATGAKFTFTAAAANTTTTPTLSIDGLPAETLVHADGSALAAGDILADATVEVYFDGTNFRILGMYSQSAEFDRIVAPGGTVTGDISMSGNLTISGSGSLTDPNAQWLGKAVGEVFPLMTYLTGVTEPPTTSSLFRFIKLTASDSYNAGVLTSESVSGSDPTITATAVVSLTGSPLNGRTVHLLNTERYFLRPGTSGVGENSANLSHSHTGGAVSAGNHAHTGTTDSAGNHSHTIPNTNIGQAGGGSLILGSTDVSYTGNAGAHTHTFTTGAAGTHTHDITITSSGGSESRPRYIGATYYMRIL
ncbi:hypothetical protein CEY11_09475 [Candidimonas nitroreducens]|uniref:Phage tail collar domain-containing protein n=1 Tax=Candidimonas nitroreducens TaxID=683354 RepID=A0A225MLH4_9BURK|nr:hypothetical protein CEY11_09475 [Candidimonas nitroreducens]